MCRYYRFDSLDGMIRDRYNKCKTAQRRLTVGKECQKAVVSLAEMTKNEDKK